MLEFLVASRADEPLFRPKILVIGGLIREQGLDGVQVDHLHRVSCVKIRLHSLDQAAKFDVGLKMNQMKNLNRKYD